MPGKGKAIKMRAMIKIIIIIVIITIISISGYYLLNVYTNDIHHLLEELQEKVENNNWNQAQETKLKLTKKWKQAKSFFPIIVDHAIFFDLEISLIKIFNLIDLQEQKEITLEIAIAKRLIKYIPEQEKLNLRNIF